MMASPCWSNDEAANLQSGGVDAPLEGDAVTLVKMEIMAAMATNSSLGGAVGVKSVFSCFCCH